MSRVFTNGPEDLGSIPGRVIPKALKMVLDTSLLNTQQCKVRIEGNNGAIQGKEQRPPLHLGVVATSFPGLLHFTLDTYLTLLSVKEVSSTIFKVFGITRPGIEPRSSGPLVNTLTIMPK